MCAPSNRELIIAFSVACRNWLVWQDVWEFEGKWGDFPLLRPSGRFICFCREYKVGRGVPNTILEDIANHLLDDPVVCDSGENFSYLLSSGRIECCADYINRRFNVKRQTVMMTKIASFWRPEKYVARDSYSLEGSRILGIRSSLSYIEFSKEISLLWRNEFGIQVSDFLNMFGELRCGNTPVSCCKFKNRMLDVCLMIRGGRLFL